MQCSVNHDGVDGVMSTKDAPKPTAWSIDAPHPHSALVKSAQRHITDGARIGHAAVVYKAAAVHGDDCATCTWAAKRVELAQRRRR
jgi:hypothetical protein